MASGPRCLKPKTLRFGAFAGIKTPLGQLGRGLVAAT
jgi:hypothetical protein